MFFRVPRKEVGRRNSITFFRFRGPFGHFLGTFSDASVTFFVTFLPNSVAGLLLRQGDLLSFFFLFSLSLKKKKRFSFLRVEPLKLGVSCSFSVLAGVGGI